MSRIARPIFALALFIAGNGPWSEPVLAQASTTTGVAQSTQLAPQPSPGPDVAWWAPTTGNVAPPRYSGITRTSRYVTMPDGVRLAADIYLPKNLEVGARLPTILEQTRYLRSLVFKPEVREAMDRPAQKVVEFVTRGYAYVVTDVRGDGRPAPCKSAPGSQGHRAAVFIL